MTKKNLDKRLLKADMPPRNKIDIQNIQATQNQMSNWRLNNATQQKESHRTPTESN